MLQKDLTPEEKKAQAAFVFFCTVFSQTKELPDIRSTSGELINNFADVLRPILSKLHSIDPSFPNDILVPIDGMRSATRILYRSLKPEQREQIDAIRREKESGIQAIINDHIAGPLAEQTIDFLETPAHFHKQIGTRACESACFRMIYESITGQAIEELTLFNAAHSEGVLNGENSRGESVDSEVLLNVFNTPEFKESYPNYQVRSLRIQGMGLAEINKIVRQVKEAIPNTKVYCGLSVASEVVEGGWHSVLLLSADKENVFVHDPSPRVGYANKQIPKAEFAERWGKTFLNGYLVFASDVSTEA